MWLRLLLFLFAFDLTLGGEPPSASNPPSNLDAAIELFHTRKYPDARAALEKLVAAEPANAAALYYLGRTLELRGDADGLPDAIKQYEKALALEPNNATYLARFGGASLQLAGRTNSIMAARRGRDAMEKALTINPDDLDAREGLMQFYQRAPWPLGSSAKAAEQLEQIRRRDPARATVLSVLQKTADQDYAGAFKLCDDALAQSPSDYNAHYQYGRTAAISGENLVRGLASLRKCLTLEPPSPASPSHSNVWLRIGSLEEKFQHPAEARAAYETALKLDSTNRQAADALAKLKP